MTAICLSMLRITMFNSCDDDKLILAIIYIIESKYILNIEISI